MKQKLLPYFFVFFSVFGLHELLIFTLTTFIFWSMNPLAWDGTGRGAFYILTVLNFIFSAYLSLWSSEA